MTDNSTESGRFICLECNSLRCRSELGVDVSYSGENPWSYVAELDICEDCGTTFPASLSRRINNITVESARSIWVGTYNGTQPRKAAGEYVKSAEANAPPTLPQPLSAADAAARRKRSSRFALATFAVYSVVPILNYSSTIDRALEVFAILTPTGPLALLALFWLIFPLLPAALLAGIAYGLSYVYFEAEKK